MNELTAKDLMVGDWVTCSINNKYYKVSALTTDIELEGDRFIFYSRCDDIEPIPLTADILEKNGFEYKEADETCATEAFHHWHLVGSRFAIDDDSWWRSVKDGELHVKFGGFPLKYLHELQHALRLAGIEKEITI